ncbi:MAG TPA: DUF87 domain-containing protein [archaeon]|nr:DUF87 domain-containing protein [archaeon]
MATENGNKGKEADEMGEKARDFGEDERIEKTTVNPAETDLFDEVLSGKKKQAVEKLKDAMDKNEDEILGDEEDAEEGDLEDDDEEKEDTKKSAGGAEDDPEDMVEPVLVKEETDETELSKPRKKKSVAPKQKKIKKETDEEPTEEEEEKAEDDDFGFEEGKNEEEGAKDSKDKNADEWSDDEFDYDVDHDSKEPDEMKAPIGEAAPVVPHKDAIRKKIMDNAAMASEGIIDEGPSAEKLTFLADKEKNSVFIGRKASIFKRFGYEAALHIGRVNEKEFENNEVFLDSLNPHVVFVCGARGSGKSYVLGVVAEELAEKNRNVGTIVVDPVGVFWSMKFPNKDEKEIEKLREWGLEPKGLSNIKVFIPFGMMKEVPKSTYNAGFSIQPSLLTGEDWALTFGVDRFSVSGLLLEKALKKVEKGYTQIEPEEKAAQEKGEAKRPQKSRKIEGKGKDYSLEDLIRCLETDAELNSRDKGYKQDSIRAIVSRFEAAKNWGIFHSKGTPLGELSREGQLTILDTSFLEDNVTALVIGILARRLLAARKISTRKEAANKFKELNMNELLEQEVPPTWLFIDEAHTLIPSGNEVTPATAGLIEYVKQGRRPGLSLVFATQQPSAINTKVLSQLDVIMTHKLIFDDDIKAVFKRTPTIIPRRYRVPNFIKTLPVGVALTGDRREETSRAFVIGIRPRKSQHEGRDAESNQMTETFDESQVQNIAIEMLLRDINSQKKIDLEKARLAVDTLNLKYRGTVDFKKVLAALAAKGIVIGSNALMLAGVAEAAESDESEEETEQAEEPSEDSEDEEIENTQEDIEKGLSAEEIAAQELKGTKTEASEVEEGDVVDTSLELLALPVRVQEEACRRIVEGVRRKGFLGLFGNSERIESIQLKYSPLWRVKFDSLTGRKEFISRECFINSMTGEFVHFHNGDFVESVGLRTMSALADDEIRVVSALHKREMLIEEIMANASLDEARARRVLQKLLEGGIITKITDKRSGKVAYAMKQKMDLPPNERHDLLGSLAGLPFVKAEALSVEKENYTKEDAADAMKRIWPGIIVKKVEPLYKPVWEVVLSLDAKQRVAIIDAVNGKIIGNEDSNKKYKG